MTQEQIAAHIAALQVERKGYELKGNDDRVGQVDAQLKIYRGQQSKAAKA